MSKRLAILGAGPIGIESAVRAVAEGYDVSLYEAGRVGEYLRQWDHVEMFSPWSLNRSRWGESYLRGAGVDLEPGDQFPTGAEYRRRYMQPLAQIITEELSFYGHTKVTGISRKGALKGELIGDEKRVASPFLLRVDGPDGLRFDEADYVIDATGVLANPNPIGPGGLPALGEKSHDGAIIRGIPDVDDDQLRADLSGRRLLVVGHGHSALTSLERLHRLHQQDSETQVIWAFRGTTPPREIVADDPLPQRARLDRFGNSAARGDIDGIVPRPHSMVWRIEEAKGGLDITLRRNDTDEIVQIDRIVANVGYRPDTSIYGELQIHLCYASDGPMKLAAGLLAQSGNADCLATESGGVQTLRNPEPGFFILGAKSFGRNSNFLLRIGFEQIDDLFTAGLANQATSASS